MSGGFLHASLLHIAFNMYFVYFLGNMLEPAIGKLRFGALYIVSLLGGSLGALLLSFNSPTVGASGAAFGLLAGAIILMRSRGINPMESGLVMLLVLNLGITFILPGISVGGHVGGIIAGGMAALLLFEVGEKQRGMRQAALGATVLLGAVLAVVCVVYSRSRARHLGLCRPRSATACSRAGSGVPGALRLLGSRSGGRIDGGIGAPWRSASACSPRAGTAGTPSASATSCTRRRFGPAVSGSASASSWAC